MAEKRLVEMMGGAASVPKVVASSEVNYFWKKFDFTSGRTFNQVLNEHPYCKNPVASTSKLDTFKVFRSVVFAISPRRRLLFHERTSQNVRHI